MKYINKNLNLEEGHSITDHYLETVCRVDDGDGTYHYRNVDYEGSFSSSGSKSDMQRLVLENQANYCCYCMRDLHMQNQRVTLEHIIPQSVGQGEFRLYTCYNVSPITEEKVIRTDDFSRISNVEVPPRPHTVTFENLVASCDGTFPDKEGTARCCNHRRGDKYVYPLFYDATVENELVYMEDGTMMPGPLCAHEKEYIQTISNVNLNCDNLRDIRRLWRLLVNEDKAELFACIYDRNQRQIKLMAVLFQNNELKNRDAEMYGKFMMDDYWKTFLMYHWFHHKE